MQEIRIRGQHASDAIGVFSCNCAIDDADPVVVVVVAAVAVAAGVVVVVVIVAAVVDAVVIVAAVVVAAAVIVDAVVVAADINCSFDSICGCASVILMTVSLNESI